MNIHWLAVCDEFGQLYRKNEDVTNDVFLGKFIAKKVCDIFIILYAQLNLRHRVVF